MTDGAVAIVGAGTMGHGIAVRFADAGWRVTLVDPSERARRQAVDAISAALNLLCDVDGSPAERAAAALDRLTWSSDLPAVLPGLIVETVPEEADLKREVLQSLEERAPNGALLCTNTSAIAISSLADGLRRPERFVGTHFWNPPYILPCVEVVLGNRTESATADAVAAALRSVGSRPVRIDRDVPGFVGNRLQHALLREALYLVESGVATAQQVDEVVTQGLGLRMALMGPLERADLGGLDVTGRVQEYVLPHLEGSTTRSKVLTDRMAAGEYGAKTGKGFYTWDEETLRQRIRQRDEALLRILKLTTLDQGG